MPELAMTPAEIDAFLAPPRDAVLGTIARDGSPVLNPIWYQWDGEAFLFSIEDTLHYAKNIVRDPRISLVVHQESSPVAAIVARGAATWKQDVEQGVMRGICLRYYGPERGPLAADENWRTVGEHLLAFRLEPDRLVSWTFAKAERDY